MSKLKRKCLERDQVLAKLVLKLRKKKRDGHDEANESLDDSTASSSGFERILAQADSLIRGDASESEWSETDQVHLHAQPGSGANGTKGNVLDAYGFVCGTFVRCLLPTRVYTPRHALMHQDAKSQRGFSKIHFPCGLIILKRCWYFSRYAVMRQNAVTKLNQAL